MLIRGTTRLVPIVGTISIIAIIALSFYNGKLNFASINPGRWSKDAFPGANGRYPKQWQDTFSISPQHDDSEAVEKEMASEHRIVYSVSTADKKYFAIEFDQEEAINPNIIPHPIFKNTWIIAAQLQRSDVKNSVWFAELVCNAVFKDGKLACVKPPMMLPIAATGSGKCTGELAFFALNIGPHDARVFYGPDNPFAVFGSQSAYTCFGQWIQDLRMLVDWGLEIPENIEAFVEQEVIAGKDFRTPTELQRPLPYGSIEKNWFIFWDKDGQIYAHYDIAPNRVFAKLDYDGSIGQDLAPLAAANDEPCMTKYMPNVAEKLESIHQASNSLSITLCERLDPSCKPNDSNTFIFTIFQHKSFYYYHGVYEPYVMLFKQTEPFEIYAISTKPMWIHGRDRFKGQPKPGSVVVTDSDTGPDLKDQTEMFYVTSMSWKSADQKYHGYRDDVLFVAFGIEDSRTAGIDIKVGDLLMDLGLCSA